MGTTNNSKGIDDAYTTNNRELSRKTDLRVIRTRKMLWEALVRLIENRDFATITVGEITREAMINRATFYRHYEDKEDLLERGTAEVIKGLAAKIQPVRTDRDTGMFEPVKQGLSIVLDHLSEHSAFYRVMLGSEAGVGLRRGIRDVIDTFILDKIDSSQPPNAPSKSEPSEVSRSRLHNDTHGTFRQPPVPSIKDAPGSTPTHLVPDVLIARTVSSVVMGLLTWWIEEKKPISKEELIDYYLRIMVLGPYRCL